MTRSTGGPAIPPGNPATLLPGNPMRSVLLALLIFEMILFGLAIPVMVFVSDVNGAAAAALGGGGILLALLSLALMRKPIGFVLGWVTQAVGVALGFVTSAMFAVGGMFALLWVITFVLGKRLDAGSPPAAAR